MAITMIDYSRPLKERAARRKFCGPYQWTPTKPGVGRGFYQSSRGLACDERGSTFDLRLERPAGDDAYAFNDFGECYRPIIARLPHGRGFLAGATMGEGMSAFLDPEIWHDEEEAGDAAHGAARIAAERQREEEESDETCDECGAHLDGPHEIDCEKWDTF